MPQYRVEISPNNRAGCKDSVCKKEKIKIKKGEIRFGTWVEIDEHASWAWKHWGCVSGDQMLRLREQCDKGDDEWDFDEIDGYDELTDSDVQEKVRRCVKQAHIDAEDFKGDPEKNFPGVTGIRLTAKQREKKEREAAAEAEAEDTPKGKKRARSDKPKPKAKGKKAKAEESEDDEDAPPAKAKAAPKAKATKKTKVKAEEDDEEDDAPPAKKTKTAAKKAQVKDESEEEKPKPKRRGRSAKA